MSTMFNRYDNDPTTVEQDLHTRSGQIVEVIGDPVVTDEVDQIIMQHVRFEDGFETDAFVDELTQAWSPEEMHADFEVIWIVPPLASVRRKSDGARGSLLFDGRGSARIYHHFVPED